MTVPPAAKKLRSDGFEALKQQRDAAAAELLSRYLDTVPDDVEAELALAVARSGQGKHAAALAIFERHLERDPKSPVLHFNRATTLERLGRKVDAVQAYELVLRLNPNHAKARLRLDTLCGNAAKSAVGQLGTSSSDEETPFVIAVDDEDPPEKRRQPAGKDRWIHPVWLALLFLFAVGLIAVAGVLVSVTQAGAVAGELLLANILLLTGIQTVHDARRGKKYRPAARGYTLAAIGGLAIIGCTIDLGLSTIRAQQFEERRAASALIQQAEAKAKRAEMDKRMADAREQSEKRNAQEIDKLIVDLKSGNKSRTVSACARLSGFRPTERQPEVANLLERLLSNPDWLTVLQAADALAKWGTKESIPKLEALLSNKNGSIRSHAQETIKSLKNRS